jgi:hypothetical protein
MIKLQAKSYRNFSLEPTHCVFWLVELEAQGKAKGITTGLRCMYPLTSCGRRLRPRSSWHQPLPHVRSFSVGGWLWEIRKRVLAAGLVPRRQNGYGPPGKRRVPPPCGPWHSPYFGRSLRLCDHSRWCITQRSSSSLGDAPPASPAPVAGCRCSPNHFTPQGAPIRYTRGFFTNHDASWSAKNEGLPRPSAKPQFFSAMPFWGD